MARTLQQVTASAEQCEAMVRELSERAMLRPAPLRLLCRPYRPDVRTDGAVAAVVRMHRPWEGVGLWQGENELQVEG